MHTDAAMACDATSARCASSVAPPKCIKIVDRVCKTYSLQLDPGLKPTGPSGHVCMRDIFKLLYERSKCIVQAGLTCDGTSVLWPYKKCNDMVSLGMELKEEVVVFDHQAETLKKMNCDGNTRSCNVKMPCAAGKTLLGLLHICELQTSAIIFTNSNMASQHWLDQVHQFFKPPENGVVILSPDSDGLPTVSLKTLVYEQPSIVICTYQLMTSTQEHTESLTEVIEYVSCKPWGVKILDEAQTATAHSHKKVLAFQSYTTVTVSASYKREDDEIKHLFEQVSEEIITVDREDLVKKKLLPGLRRVEVHIDPFGTRRRDLTFNERQLSAIVNPKKMSVCLSLINYHMQLKDKVIMCCDSLRAVDLYLAIMQQFQFESRLELCGKITMHTPLAERLKTLDAFRQSSGGSVLLMARVGDVSIDLPGANILIQTSCVDKSKNQEIQRTGRIQRRSSKQGKHISYCLITAGSEEAQNVVPRRNYMTEEGYVTTVVIASQTRDSRYDDTSHAGFAHAVCQSIPE